MESFRELVARDIEEIYLDGEAFASLHIVDGKEIICVCDEDSYADRASELGITSEGMRLFAESGDLGDERRAGDVMAVDGKLYAVEEWQEDMGVATVTLRSNVPGNY